jgi:hypothetical protein
MIGMPLTNNSCVTNMQLLFEINKAVLDGIFTDLLLNVPQHNSMNSIKSIGFK